MRVVITGGRGFLGRLLADALTSDGDEVVALTRGSPAGRNGGPRAVTWTPDGSVGPWAATLDGAAAVVNLAGESIAGRRWTAAHKDRIRHSRLLATRSVVAAINGAAAPPPVLVSGSAVGYYGPRGDEVVTEDTPAGSDFLGQVAAAWEAEAGAARTRRVCIRTGIVLHSRGGALPQMLPPFWFGAGGPVGSGRQYWPWIHWKDWVDLVRFAIRTESASGPLNATAPNPVTNRDFARALGRALHRPAFLPAPAFALRLLLGEMADALLLSGQRVVPARAEQLGFSFSFRDAEETLQAVLK
jgi:hypothetical protein